MVTVEIQEAAKRGARFLELRLDFIARAPDLRRLLRDKPCPMIATVRRRQDGGRWNGTEDARQMLLKHCIVGGFDWIDLETDIADEIRRFKEVKRIVSYHNLTEFPEDLEEIYAGMCKQDADVLKLVVCAQTPVDNLRVLNLLRGTKRPTVAFCSGDIGYPSRILSLKFGSPFTYAAFNKERGVVPGMPAFDELKRIYRPGEIDSDTTLYGVVGDPVAQSLSPLVHNAAFRELKINARYVPFRVPAEDLDQFITDASELDIRGLSVTIPHKEAVLRRLTKIDGAVVGVGAANTIVFQDSQLHGYNTDYRAAMDCLESTLGIREDEAPNRLTGKTALVLGAGGAAKAIAYGLIRRKMEVVICGRTFERAQKLAQRLGCRAIEWPVRHTVAADILVNCTPVGMHPNVDETPYDSYRLRPSMVVFDTVYNPENTLLVKDARGRNCTVITGVEMFVRQASLQFQLFTGQEAPADLMRDVLKRATGSAKQASKAVSEKR
jgi:3-dehydroquinate dehydratase/shikimate dehydrogenase